MVQNPLRRWTQDFTRLLRALTRLTPWRIARHFKSVSRRLDEITRLIQSESAARVDQGLLSAREVERVRREIENLVAMELRLHEKLAAIEPGRHEKLTAIEHRLHETLTAIEHRLHEKLTVIEPGLHEKLTAIEPGLREKLAAIEHRLHEKLTAIEHRLHEFCAKSAEMVAEPFDRLSVSHKSHFEDLQSSIINCESNIITYTDMIKAWHLDITKLQACERELAYEQERRYLACERELRFLRRQEYFRAIRAGRLAVPRLETEHPIAVSSNDATFLRGSKNHRGIPPRSKHKLYQLVGGQHHLRVLDLGCGCGRFVRSLIDDGHFAVGLDGSDYPLRNQAFEWSTIPLHLFTCDISKFFRLSDGVTDEPLLFNAITAWEVMEYIPQECLPGLFENIERHLAPGGHLLFSVATFLDWDRRTGRVWNATVKPQSWWEQRFAAIGFEIDDRHAFGEDDWLESSDRRLDRSRDDKGRVAYIVLRRKAVASVVAEEGQAWRASVA